jgi:hypothetical protein
MRTDRIETPSACLRIPVALIGILHFVHRIPALPGAEGWPSLAASKALLSAGFLTLSGDPKPHRHWNLGGRSGLVLLTNLVDTMTRGHCNLICLQREVAREWMNRANY